MSIIFIDHSRMVPVRTIVDWHNMLVRVRLGELMGGGIGCLQGWSHGDVRVQRMLWLWKAPSVEQRSSLS